MLNFGLFNLFVEDDLIFIGVVNGYIVLILFLVLIIWLCMFVFFCIECFVICVYVIDFDVDG